MVELADTLDLGSSAVRREGSNPVPATNKKQGFAANLAASPFFLRGKNMLDGYFLSFTALLRFPPTNS